MLHLRYGTTRDAVPGVSREDDIAKQFGDLSENITVSKTVVATNAQYELKEMRLDIASGQVRDKFVMRVPSQHHFVIKMTMIISVTGWRAQGFQVPSQRQVYNQIDSHTLAKASGLEGQQTNRFSALAVVLHY